MSFDCATRGWDKAACVGCRALQLHCREHHQIKTEGMLYYVPLELILLTARYIAERSRKVLVEIPGEKNQGFAAVKIRSHVGR